MVADGTIVVEVCCGGWLGKVKGDVGSVCVGEVGCVVMLLHIFLRFLFVVVPGTVVVDGSAPTGSVSPELATSTSRRASAASSCSTCCCFSSCACSASSIASSLSRQATASSSGEQEMIVSSAVGGQQAGSMVQGSGAGGTN